MPAVFSAPIVGLKPTAPQYRSRPQRRALRLRAERHRHHAGAHACRRTARGTARRALGIEWIRRRPRIADRKFRRHRFAEDYCAAVSQRVHARCVLARLPPFERRRVHLCRHVLRCHDVFDADRATVYHRERSSRFVAFRRFVCCLAGGLQIERDKCFHALFITFDICDAAFEEIARRLLAALEVCERLRERNRIRITPCIHYGCSTLEASARRAMVRKPRLI